MFESEKVSNIVVISTILKLLGVGKTITANWGKTVKGL
jgi:hypothetical protein